MKIFHEELKLQREVSGKRCDCCGVGYYTSHNLNELQEFLCFEFTGGYGSIFGDGENFECDLCQHCLKKLLGKYIRKVEENYETS